MIPVTQTILADPARNDGHDPEGQPGNCYQAAIASALELPLDHVPHFATFCDDWVERSWAWFHEQGIERSFYSGQALDDLSWPLTVGDGITLWDEIEVDRIVAVLGAGPSPRGDFRHVVVLDPETGRTIHDPHPSRRGLDLIDEVEVLFGIKADSEDR